MMLDSFQKRERALENEFFYRIDQQLLQRLKEQLKHQQEAESLASAMGMQDRYLIDHLLDVGIRSQSLFALSLVPLIHVAWADRIVQVKERAEILKVSEELGHSPHSESYQILKCWLTHVPPGSLFAAWKEYVAELAHHLSAAQFRALREETLQRARQVALVAGSSFGRGHISDTEQQALDEIEAAFRSESKV